MHRDINPPHSNGGVYVAKEPLCLSGSIGFSAYDEAIKDTDVLPAGDLNPVLMGLYGEVGGIMSAAKKHVREKLAYPGFKKAAEEEFGDTLWYFNALCRRIGISLDSVFQEATDSASFSKVCAASDAVSGAVAHVATPTVASPIDDTLFRLGLAAAGLLEIPNKPGQEVRTKLLWFARCYLEALHASNLSFADVVRRNITKTQGAFLTPNIDNLPTFDDTFGDEERLPSTFEIRINQSDVGRSYLRWNNVFIGDHLTDNIADPDGYRFHDVFHLAHAAILHWSPVFRALIKQKRKSKGCYDEEQDSGRAIVVEEGLTAWIFMRAKELNYFEGQSKVSFGILKTIEEFTAGYEVAECPLKQWEQAILQGYAVFRQLREAKGGWVIGCRESRTISFRSL